MKNCLLCSAELSHAPFLSLPHMPSCAQHLPGEEDLPNDRGIDLNLHQCPACGLVQLDCPPVNYYKDVIRSGGGTSTMLALRKDEYGRFIELGNLRGKRIVEIGCGQGEFLEILNGFPATGVGIENDPSLAAKAVAKGLDVRVDFADEPGHVIDGGPFDAFMQFNFIEHQPNPNEMVRCIANNLVDGGYGLVTAPSFEYIRNDCVYEIMRDHIAYYTVDTLGFLFRKNGFDIVNSCIVNRDTIELIVRKRPMLSSENFRTNYHEIRDELNAFARAATEDSATLAIWGASHQCFTAASFLENPRQVRYIIDSAPFKQGKYSPTSHIPIVGPDHFNVDPVSSILILAPGYTDEITSNIRRRFGNAVNLYAMRSNKIEQLP